MTSYRGLDDMKRKNVLKAQNAYEFVSKLYDSLENEGVVKSPVEGVALKEVLRMDIAEYMMYLSASDGVIAANEMKMFQAITGFKDSVGGIAEYIKENHIYSNDYESTVPYSMKVAVEAQNILSKIISQNSDPSIPETLYNLYDNIGILLIQADDDISQTERRDFHIYLNTLKNYMNQNRK